MTPHAERRTPNADEGRPAILVVEDDESLRDLLTAILQSGGYAPVGARDGRDALRRLATGWMPALITLDLRMPVMNGWEFLEVYHARAQPPPHAPVVVCTALAQNGHTLCSEVAAVVTKPFALDDLLARVHALAPLPDAA